MVTIATKTASETGQRGHALSALSFVTKSIPLTSLLLSLDGWLSLITPS